MNKVPDWWADLKKLTACGRRASCADGDNCRASPTSSLTQGTTTQNTYRLGSISTPIFSIRCDQVADELAEFAVTLLGTRSPHGERAEDSR